VSAQASTTAQIKSSQRLTSTASAVSNATAHMRAVYGLSSTVSAESNANSGLGILYNIAGIASAEGSVTADITVAVFAKGILSLERNDVMHVLRYIDTNPQLVKIATMPVLRKTPTENVLNYQNSMYVLRKE
jgi:hypothetical protein